MVPGKIFEESFGSHSQQSNAHRRGSRDRTVGNLLNGQPLTYISNDANTSEVQNPLIKRRANPNMLPDTFDGCDMSDIQKALVFLLSTRDSVLETLDD